MAERAQTAAPALATAPADTVMAAVAAAWHAILDPDPFDPQRRLIDTGADSLRLMQFMLHLEQALARQVPYNLFSPEMTPATLAASLREDASKPATLPATLPRLFYLSGLNGTDYQMVDHLRAALGDAVEITHVRSPGLDQPRALLRDMDATAAWIAADIVAAQPSGDIRLAGYSIGGMQAFAVAQRLVAAGRMVASLCLFDPIPRRSLARIARDALRRPSRLGEKLRDHAPRLDPAQRKSRDHGLLVDAALRIGAYGLAATAARFTGRRSPGDADIFRLWHHRLIAARRWRPHPLAIDALLVLTDDGARREAAAFWQQWLPRLAIVRVHGSHDLLSRTPVAPPLRAALRQHLRR